MKVNATKISGPTQDFNDKINAKQSEKTAEIKKFTPAYLDDAKKLMEDLVKDFEGLKEYEKKSLNPTFVILKETVETLNNLEVDENNFITKKSFTELNEANSALRQCAKNIPFKNKFVKSRTHEKFTLQANQKLVKITSSLIEVVVKILKKEKADKISFIKDHSSQLTIAEIDSILHTIIQKEHPSNSSDLSEKKLVLSDSTGISQLRLNITNLRDAILEADTRAISHMELKDSQRKNQISFLKNKIEILEGSIKNLDNILISDSKTDDVISITKEQLEALKKTATEKLGMITELKNKYEAYSSPNSIKKISEAKKIEINAAIQVLAAHPNPKKVKNLLTTLRHRIDKIDKIDEWNKQQSINNLQGKPSKKIEALRFLGKNAVSGIERLLHPFNSLKQAVRLEIMANDLFKLVGESDNKENLIDLETVHFTEKMLMQRLLEKSGVKNAGNLLDQEISVVLNSRPWDAIHSEFYVPARIQGKDVPLKVESITTHAGEVMNNQGRFKPLSDKAPLNQKSCAEYLRDPPNPTASGEKVIGGFNSHDTMETRHAVAAAHTDCRVNGKEIFGGTRSGVNAAYDLTQESLLDLPAAKKAKMISGLIGEVMQAPTEIAIQSGEKMQETQNTSSIKAQSTDTAEFFNEIQSDIRTQFHDFLTGTNLGRDTLKMLGVELTEFDHYPTGVNLALEKMKNDPNQNLLVTLVEKNKTLCKLLTRQAALNRTREVFLLEMARDPNFMTKIENEETILFSSVSLLTPDHLRDTLNKKFGMSGSSNEKVMLDTQVQAWKDLQTEITDKGIFINGKQVKANILTFNFGVNEGGVGLASNPVIGELVSGWEEVNTKINNDAMTSLLQHADNYINTKQNELDQTLFTMEHPPSLNRAETIQALTYDINVATQLKNQIKQIWDDGSYQIAGNEPYKLPTRVAMLSFMMGGGTTFNCKSGKDRTGQLDVEAKLLGFQIHTSGGTVPEPDRVLTDLERTQRRAFLFLDDARVIVQEQNTGWEGSKLNPRLVIPGEDKTTQKVFKGESNKTRA